MKLPDVITLPRVLSFLILVVIIYTVAVLDLSKIGVFYYSQEYWRNVSLNSNLTNASSCAGCEVMTTNITLSSVAQEDSKNTLEHYTTSVDLKPKYILLWLLNYGEKPFLETNNNSYIYKSTRNEPCILTTSRNQAEKSSALVFNGCDFYPPGNDKTLPSVRHQWQRWIFFQHEAASNPSCATEDRIRAYEKYIVYNWTMTYQVTVDVHFPYGGLIRRRIKSLSTTDRDNIGKNIAETSAGFSTRSFDAIWIVSNCDTSSGRVKVFEELVKLGMKVERWGGCGLGNPEAKWQTIGVGPFFRQYRFYFAFENSLCDGYITEKAYTAYFLNLNHGLIPIVYGAGNYSALFPPGSFINAYEMPPHEVASLVRNISLWSNAELAASPYFAWQYSHWYDYLPRKDGFFTHSYSLKLGIEALCDRLWTADRNHEPPKTISDLRAELGKCYPMPPFLNKQ